MSVTTNRSNSYKKASTSAKTLEEDPASQRFVIGKIDAGIAVLISDSVHLIEFPSLLLPAGVGPGSIVNIACSRNFSAEREATSSFWDLQQDIFDTFGKVEPKAPNLRVRNTTQTSVTLEWDKLELAQANLLGLSIWRNGQRLTTIPNPLHNTSTKLSGLALDTDYNFHLVLKTSAGTFTSPIVKTRTHTIIDTSGISVCFGLVEPEALLTEAKSALSAMKAKHFDKIQIDTTHFVATSAASPSNPTGGPGVEYQKALQLSIPVVSPEWVIACHREQKMVPISNYYIGTVNHAASISSAQLVTSTGQIPPAKSQPRRATASTIAEEDSSAAPVPAVAPAPSSAPRSELADEEPETPPAEEVAATLPPEAKLPAVETPTSVPEVVPAEEVKVEEPVEEQQEEVSLVNEDHVDTPVIEAPGTPTITFTAPDDDDEQEQEDEPEPEPEVEPEVEAETEPVPVTHPIDDLIEVTPEDLETTVPRIIEAPVEEPVEETTETLDEAEADEEEVAEKKEEKKAFGESLESVGL